MRGKITFACKVFTNIKFFKTTLPVEFGHFKRRDRGDFRGRDRGDFRDRDRGEYRGRDQRDRGEYRNRGDFREREHEESVFSKRVRAGKRRTYFFDVRKTRGNDFFITITESTRREDGYGYKRHKIFLYKEDFNRFVASLNEVVNHVKTDLMPDFDYEEFDRRQAEWEAQNRDFDEEEDDFDREEDASRDVPDEDAPNEDAPAKPRSRGTREHRDDDEMSW